MPLPSVVGAVAGAYLDAVDALAPGLVEGLYLTGSVALGDFRPQTSDVDFVAVTARRPGAAGLTALAAAHTRLRRRWPRPFFDGVYVTWEDLARDPAAAAGCPHSHEGRFRADAAGSGDPVTWQTVARYGVPVRGPDPVDLDIWADPHGLARWTARNLETYWRRLLDSASRPTSPWGLAASTPYGAVWIVLGVSRLHYTLATGDITSKAGAGRYALRVFPPRWHRVVHESLRIRRADRARPDLASAIAGAAEFLPWRRAPSTRSLYRTPAARRRKVLAFGDMVLADARPFGSTVSPA